MDSWNYCFADHGQMLAEGLQLPEDKAVAHAYKLANEHGRTVEYWTSAAPRDVYEAEPEPSGPPPTTSTRLAAHACRLCRDRIPVDV